MLNHMRNMFLHSESSLNVSKLLTAAQVIQDS